MSVEFYNDVTVSHFTDEYIKFSWLWNHDDVKVCGEFDNWKAHLPLVKMGGLGLGRRLKLLKYNSEYQYKYIVNGKWRINEEEMQTTDRTGKYTNNKCVVKYRSEYDKKSSANETKKKQRLVYFTWDVTKAHSVYVVGDFDNWTTFYQLERASNGNFYGAIHIEEGRNFYFKYLVDGKWVINKSIAYQQLFTQFFLERTVAVTKQIQEEDTQCNVSFVPYMEDDLGIGIDIEMTVKSEESGSADDAFDFLNLSFGGLKNPSYTSTPSISPSPVLAMALRQGGNRARIYQGASPEDHSVEEVIPTLSGIKGVFESDEGETMNEPRVNIEYLIDLVLFGQKMDRNTATFLISTAKRILEKESNVLKFNTECYIISDLHGNVAQLLDVLAYTGFLLDEKPKFKIVVLGDMVDSKVEEPGYSSLDVVFLCLALKVKFPDSFYIVRGNHETRSCSYSDDDSISDYYNFNIECSNYYDESLLVLFHSCFDMLPLAVLIGKDIVCIHGGISPTLYSVEDIEIVDRRKEPPLCELHSDILWADPYMGEDYNYCTFSHNSQRGCSYYFGKYDTEQFLLLNNLKCLIRGHSHPPYGYEVRMGENTLHLTICTGWTASDVSSLAWIKSDGRLTLLTRNKASSTALDQYQADFLFNTSDSKKEYWKNAQSFDF